MTKRTATITRTTKETDITISLSIDGTGKTSIDTGIPFFDHMLDALARHGLFDLELRATGDLEVDAHHTVEDVGIVLGQALAKAMGDKRGITRFASQAVPMDEALVMGALDISGRGQMHFDILIPPAMMGLFDASLAKEFFIALASNAGITLHLVSFKGENAHHLIEAAFKATGRVLRSALEIDARASEQLPSTKGTLA
jgi:imidazoleglycerol-phosphate dehydratase